MSRNELTDNNAASSVAFMGSTHSMSGTDTNAEQDRETIEAAAQVVARKESKAVVTLRISVVIVLIISAGLVCGIVYSYMKEKETEAFASAFSSNADKIVESFNVAVEGKLSAMDAFSVTITAYAVTNQLTFPFVTLPFYEIRGCNYRVLADGIRMDWYALVTESNRLKWEAYTQKGHVWADDAMVSDAIWRHRQDEQFGYNSSLQENITEYVRGLKFRPYIFQGGTPGNLTPYGTGPYLAYWQSSPLPSNKFFMNMNGMAFPPYMGAMKTAMTKEEAVLSQALQLLDPNEHANDRTANIFDAFIINGQYRYDRAKLSGDPSSNLAYPVFDSFHPDQRKPVGIIQTALFWRVYFTDVLPQQSRGVIVVLKNSPHNQSFTYRIDGPEPTFLGPGDRHDPKYDSMGVSEDVIDYIHSRAGPESSAYTQVKMNGDYCRYSIHVYPSQDMEDDFITKEPIIFTIVILAVYLFTSLVFVAYDHLVEHRQRVIMRHAIRSDAVVSSLFPKIVRDRLLDETLKTTSQQPQKNNPWARTAHKGSLTKYLTHSSEAIGGQIVQASEPIADVYEATTIMFGDIAGFTQWSSTRTPNEVFQLLETIYSAFDRYAERRDVFKVETIGDCYVAVTGVPNPQDDHAIIMVKFARDCMNKMNVLAQELKHTLGQTTCQLQMRIGLHSGSVTGGVLRGQKSRFQLFGDTMNTASRMESNGIKGRIQISQATADELIQNGHESWIHPREETIFAKGKGEMQTYWVSVKETTAAASPAAPQQS